MPARDAAAGDHRRLRDRRRHPGAAQLGGPRRVPGRGLPAARLRRVARHRHAGLGARTVDAELRGCPIDPGQLLELLTALRIGRRPQLPDEAVCLECKRRGIVCVLVAGGAPCLGPVTQTGCGAICPAFGARLLRLLRAARAGERRQPRAAGSARDRPPDAEVDRLFAGFTALGARRSARSSTPCGGPPVAAKPSREDARCTARMSRGTTDQRFKVRQLTRVEGEGSLALRVRDGEVDRGSARDLRGAALLRAAGGGPDAGRGDRHRGAHLRHLPGRLPDVGGARVRATCSGVGIDPEVRALRRLLLLRRVDREPRAPHLPAPRARLPRLPERGGARARPSRGGGARARASRRLGNRIVAILGGRPIHPVSVRVGGFSRAPRRAELDGAAAEPRRVRSAERSGDRPTGWPTLAAPAVRAASRALVALRHPDEYPMNDGRIVSSDGLDIAPADWARGVRGGSGPVVARPPGAQRRRRPVPARPDRAGRARAATAAPAERRGARAHRPRRRDRPQRRSEHRRARGRARPRARRGGRDPRRLCAAEPRRSPPWTPRAGIAAWATEAPRGLLFHRYEVDDRGRVATRADRAADEPEPGRHRARPRVFAPACSTCRTTTRTHRLEQLIRSYDPCISCATHFLDLTLEDAR